MNLPFFIRVSSPSRPVPAHQGPLQNWDDVSPRIFFPKYVRQCLPSPSIALSCSPVQSISLEAEVAPIPVEKGQKELTASFPPLTSAPAGRTGRWVSYDNLEKVRDQWIACKYESPLTRLSPWGDGCIPLLMLKVMKHLKYYTTNSPPLPPVFWIQANWSTLL